jgi:hypothetical protein
MDLLNELEQGRVPEVPVSVKFDTLSLIKLGGTIFIVFVLSVLVSSYLKS